VSARRTPGTRTARHVVLGVLLLGGAACAIDATTARADDTTWLTGTWQGDRHGSPVTWSFTPDGRMRLEDRGASWSAKQDTLVVDLDPLGENTMGERAVYRFLTSNPHRGRRLLFVRGFDLGLEGLLLAREEAGAEGASSPDVDATSDGVDPATTAPRRAP